LDVTQNTSASAEDISNASDAENLKPSLQAQNPELNERSMDRTSERTSELRTLNSVDNTTAMETELYVEPTDNMLEQLGDVQSSMLQLGVLDISSNPEAEDPPEVVGTINGHEA
jgi:hypothetical protein